ncbi:unnamed protein product [Lasius platythorax]|uniref:Uncharacterized protein n=1 Tax=Lasius platythorax TaxID=488582 RepID=A0AAV2NGB4_9HYME
MTTISERENTRTRRRDQDDQVEGATVHNASEEKRILKLVSWTGCIHVVGPPSHRRQTFRLRRNNRGTFPADLPLGMLFGFREKSGGRRGGCNDEIYNDPSERSRFCLRNVNWLPAKPQCFSH